MRIPDDAVTEKETYARELIAGGETSLAEVNRRVAERFGAALNTNKLRGMIREARGEAGSSVLDGYKKAGPQVLSDKQRQALISSWRKAMEDVARAEKALSEAQARRDEAIRRIAEARGGQGLILGGQAYEFRGRGEVVEMVVVGEVVSWE